MLGMIDKFKFEMNKNQLDAISHVIDFTWAESKRIGNNPKYQAVGKSIENFTFSGTLIMQKVTAVDELIVIAEKKEPVILTFINASSIQVIIENISMNKSLFLNSGEFLKQEFTVKIKRWYP